MRLLISGASGFLGTAWRDHLAQQGHEVLRLVRGEPMSSQESRWDPSAGEVDADLVGSVDVVACLSGAPLAHWPWTESYKQTFRESRIQTTATLARAVAVAPRPPALLAQSGIAGYGDRGEEVLTEEVPFDGDTFMAEASRAWEAAASPAVEAGARVSWLRTGVVLGSGGGAFPPLRALHALGLGGPVGSGQQYLSTLSTLDWVRAATHLAASEHAAGVHNLSGPTPLTNQEFSRTLARMLRRPARLTVPAVVVRTMLGAVASELLNSTRVVPRRLEEDGFVFEHRTQEDIIAAALGR